MNILVNLEYNPNLKSTSLMKSRKQIHVLNNSKNKCCVKESIQLDILVFWKSKSAFSHRNVLYWYAHGYIKG
jgi:hypothetical protein